MTAYGMVLLGCLNVGQDVELAWPLGNDRAAVYSAYDGANGKRLEDFWLLGGELNGKAEAFQSVDIPLRYVFRFPKAKVRPGATWTVEEKLFADFPTEWGPMAVAGSCRLRPLRKMNPKEVLRTWALEKGRPTSVEAYVIEGSFAGRRGNLELDGRIGYEKSPSTTFSTATLVRASDGAILGSRFDWSGRALEYQGNFSTSGSFTTRTYSREYLFLDQVVELSPAALRERVDAALKKATAWLKSTVRSDGQFTDPPLMDEKWAYARGYLTAVSLMALLHAGVPENDPAVAAGFRFLSSRKLRFVWDLGLALMALEAKHLPLIDYEEAVRLTEAEARKRLQSRLSPEDRALATQWATQLAAYQGRSGGFGYSDPTLENNQTTQYALLGLKSASRLGIEVSPDVWRGGIRFVEDSSVPTGKGIETEVRFVDGTSQKALAYEQGWTYVPLEAADRVPGRMNVVDTNGVRVMTALASLALCKSELARLKLMDARMEQRISNLEWGAIAWWALNPGLRAPMHEGCMGLAAHTPFYRWSAERAGVFAGIESINGRAWFLEGSAHILSGQRPQGFWDAGRGTPVADTAFSVLFLKRGLLPVESPRPLPPSLSPTMKEKAPGEKK